MPHSWCISLTLHNHVPFSSTQSLSRGHMPYIESLHDGGMGFSASYVQRWCTPTRAAIQTGRFPFRNGWNQYGDSMAEELSSIPLSFELLPSVRVLVQSPAPHYPELSFELLPSCSACVRAISCV
jgi:hypothetical protein